jgi:hypothetical protein
VLQTADEQALLRRAGIAYRRLGKERR